MAFLSLSPFSLIGIDVIIVIGALWGFAFGALVFSWLLDKIIRLYFESISGDNRRATTKNDEE